MKTKSFFIISVLIIASFFLGCTRTYIVKPLPFEPELTPKATNLKGPVTLINDQPAGTKIVFKSSTAIDWVGDLSDWTGQAIDLLAYELQKRNVTVSPAASKKLHLSVVSGTLRSEVMAGVRCIIKLKVTAGNGYSREFEGNYIDRASPFGEMARFYAGANALTAAVIALLNDDDIIGYLQE